MKLSLKTTLLVGAVFIAFSVSVSTFIISSESQHIYQEGLEEAKTLNYAAVNSLLGVMQQGGRHEDLDEMIVRLRENAEYHELRVIPGEPVIQQFGSKPGEQPRDELEQRALKGEYILDVTEHEGVRVIRYMTPMVAEAKCQTCHQVEVGEVLGATLVHISLEARDRALKERRNAIMGWISLGVLGLGLVTIFVVQRSVVHPIRKVQEGAHILASGDLNLRLPLDQRKDEIGDLARSFNQMAESLAANFEELKLYLKAFNGTADAVIITDLEKKIIQVNPAFEMITGYPRDEVIGHPFTTLNIGQDDPDFFQQIWDQIHDLGHWSGEFTYQRQDGEKRISSSSISVVRDQSQNPIAYVIVLRDITDAKRRQREREAVITVASALRKAQDSHEMMPIILEQLIDMLRADRALIAMRGQHSNEALIALGLGKWEQMSNLRLPTESGVIGQVIASGCPVVSTDMPAVPIDEFSGNPSESIAVACVPLKSQERTTGALCVGRDQPFEEEEVSILTAISDMAANAIRRAFLHEQTEQRLARINVLRSIDKTINASLDLSLTMTVLVDQIANLENIDAVGVWLYNKYTHSLELVEVQGFRTPPEREVQVRLGEGIIGQVVAERKMIHLPSLISADSPFDRLSLAQKEGFVSYYAFPLIAKAQVKGVLEIFFRKPFTAPPEWVEFLDAMAAQAAIAIDNASMYNELQRANVDLELAYEKTLEGWARALEYRDMETRGHSERVTDMTLRIAEAMGVRSDQIQHIRRGALLHDIGKMGIPDSILLKPSKLTEEEWEIMRQHPVYALEMLSPIPYLRPALNIPYYHHERWDGSGYPLGLKGDEIPLEARIFAVVDVWDALNSDRPYRKAWTKENVLRYIQEQAGILFDPKVVEAFLKEVERSP